MLIHVLNTALPVFVALFIGVLCRSRKLLSREGIDALKKLAVDITLPAVIFSAFAEVRYTAEAMLVPALIFILCNVALLLGFLMKKLLRSDSRLMPFLMTGFEAGMLGYGLFALLYPGQGTAAFAIIDLGQVLFVFTVFKAMLMGKGSARDLLRQAFASPVLWAIILGMLFGATGLYEALKPSGVSGVIDSVADFVAAPTSCLILITIGYDLELDRVPWPRVMKYTLSRAAIMLAIYAVTVWINRALLGSAIHEGALRLMLILPAPYVLPIFADVETERNDIASTLSVMTIISLILFSVMAASV